MDYLAQILVNGLHNGMIYALLAWSYVLAQSVTHRPNLVHGVLFAFSGQIVVLAAVQAYTLLWMAMWSAVLFGILASLCLTIILVFLVSAKVIQPMLSRRPDAILAVSLGLAIVITEAARLGANTRELWLPPLTNARIGISFLPGTPQINAFQFWSIMGLFAALITCETILRRSSAGRLIRAVSDDPAAAALLGTNTSRVTVATLFASGMLAGLTGMLAVLHYGNMSFGSGLIFSLKVLFLASAGGFSSPLPAALAAFAYAEGEALWDGYMPIAWRDVMFFSLLAAILVLKPQNAGKTI